MKKLQLIHQEKEEDCFEILKSTIIEDKQLKTWRIDKNTMLQNLPESIVNEFLDWLGTNERYRSLMLSMIKDDTLVVTCWDDDDNTDLPAKTKIKKSPEKKKQIYDETFDKPPSREMPF